MPSNIIPFDFERKRVRIIRDENGAPWFVLADVCRVLEIGNSRQVASKLDDDERRKLDMSPETWGVTISDGANINDLGAGEGNNEAWIINESGLYSLILRSRKPEAKRFKKWVTAEVLPSIRKTGGYGTQRDPMEALDDPDTLRSLLLSYSGKVKTLEVQVSTLAPKAEALDRIATTDGSLCITDAAKTLQVPPRELFRYLRSNGWVYSRAGGSEIGYQEHINAGRLEHKTTTVSRSDGSEKAVTQVRITPKGLTGLAMAFRKSQPVPVQAVSASLL